jgi:hypothetical protein
VTPDAAHHRGVRRRGKGQHDGKRCRSKHVAARESMRAIGGPVVRRNSPAERSPSARERQRAVREIFRTSQRNFTPLDREKERTRVREFNAADMEMFMCAARYASRDGSIGPETAVDLRGTTPAAPPDPSAGAESRLRRRSCTLVFSRRC